MSKLFYPPLTNGLQKTLDAQLDEGHTTAMTLNNTTGVQNKPGVIVLNRIDSSSNEKTSSVREFVSYTGTSGNTLTGLNRGLAGSTDQDHAVGSIVEFILDITWGQAVIDALNRLVDENDLSAQINDANDNELINFTETASAVNELTIANAVTGNAPKVEATGGDTNIDLELKAKGTGKIKQDAIYQTPQTYTPTAGATATIDLSTGNEHRVTMPAGNITIAISNETDGQKFIISITQDGTGSRTATWFSTIKWAGGSAPTLTTTASKRDIFGFIVTGADQYDGLVIDQDI